MISPTPPPANRYLKIQLGKAIVDSGELNFFELIKYKITNKTDFFCLGLAEERIAKGGIWQKRFAALTRVSARSIEMQAELIQVIKRGKIWALGQCDPQPMGKTQNLVYQLKEREEVFGYLKVGKGNPAVGKMEKLVWGVANWLGFQESFAPTEIAQFATINNTLCGSVQVAQAGKWLNKLEDRESVSKKEVLEGILVSVVLGMNDAHRIKNIIVTDEGKIKFFDNTQSLRHSNGFIKYTDGCVRAAYRCALLDLPAAKERLTDEEKEALKRRISELKQKVASLESDYFESYLVKRNLEKIPSDWMDKKAMLTALKDRIKALEQGVINTAQDLVLCVFPEYKFVFALTFAHLHRHRVEYSLDHLHHEQGFFPLETLLAKEIDLRQVKEWCDDDGLSLDDLVLNIQTGIDDGSLMKGNEAFCEELRRDILSRAVLDMKDTVII